MPRLTKPLLLAMEEALLARLAGERDNDGHPDAPTTEHYERALGWVTGRLSPIDRDDDDLSEPPAAWHKD